MKLNPPSVPTGCLTRAQRLKLEQDRHWRSIMKFIIKKELIHHGWGTRHRVAERLPTSIKAERVERVWSITSPTCSILALKNPNRLYKMVQLATRKIGNDDVTAIGFGLMGLSAFYGDIENDEERFKVGAAFSLKTRTGCLIPLEH